MSLTPKPLNRKYAAAKVPEITVMFWLLKLLTTGMGESISDFLSSHLRNGGRLAFDGAILLIVLTVQLWQDKYRAACYWAVVAAIAIFGTSVADDSWLNPHLPYLHHHFLHTSEAFALLTVLVFIAWYLVEGTLNIHSITTRRRELFYWLAVFCSFTFGTALGDYTASVLGLGLPHSILLFAGIMLIPLVGWWKLGMNPILAFWIAYVDTRPLGASLADWTANPPGGVAGGLGFTVAHDAITALGVFVILVTLVTVFGHGIQRPHLHLHEHEHERSHLVDSLAGSSAGTPLPEAD